MSKVESVSINKERIKLDNFPYMRVVCSGRLSDILNKMVNYCDNSIIQKTFNNYNNWDGKDDKYLWLNRINFDHYSMYDRNGFYGSRPYRPNHVKPFHINRIYENWDRLIKGHGHDNYNLYRITNTIKYNFIDISEGGYITYIPFNQSIYKEWIVGDLELLNRCKFQKIKIGKFFKSIFPKLDNSEIEKLVSLFKSLMLGKNEVFQELKGKDILKGYRTSNLRVKSTLGRSCMNNKPKSFFDIYTKNPDKVSLLVLKDTIDDKIIGRALLWRSKDGIVMDRVYYFDEYVYEKFYLYSVDKKYLHRDLLNSSRVKLDVYGEKSITNYPYLDTYKYLDEYNGILFSDFFDFENSKIKVKLVKTTEYSKFKLFLMRIFNKKKYRKLKNKYFKKLTSTGGVWNN